MIMTLPLSRWPGQAGMPSRFSGSLPSKTSVTLAICSLRFTVSPKAPTVMFRSRSVPCWPIIPKATLAQARQLWEWVGRPNLMVKIPATPEGIPAVRAAIAAGINVNVTLIFSLERYRLVMEAYLAGLSMTVWLPISRSRKSPRWPLSSYPAWIRKWMAC